MPLDVCVVGSANLDLVAFVERIPGRGETLLASDYFEAAGGKGLNQAVAAARSGARTALVARLGDDAAGDALLEVMTADGIDVSGVSSVDAPTGRAMIAVGADGENSIVVVPGANATLGTVAIGMHGPVIARASIVLAQLEVPLESVIAAFEVARAVGATTVLNPAPARSLPRELLLLVDVLVPNEHEVELLGGTAHLIRSGVSAVVVTEGARGARLVTSDGETRVKPFAVTAIDTTGAGDTFCGALAARLAAGRHLEQALTWASAAAALATTVNGAVPSIPTAARIQQLIASAA
ncbi:MAG: ribokinase [Acidimicrobiia bacterium]